jgi:uncharacterized membrane protein (UPF0136 family)
VNQWLLYSIALLAWTVATASGRTGVLLPGRRRDDRALSLGEMGVRAGLAAVAVLVAVWDAGAEGLMLAVGTAGAVLVATEARHWAARRQRLPEVEVAVTLASGLVLLAIVRVGELEVGLPWLVSQPQDRLAAWVLTAAAMVLAVWHSGHVVRGFLQKSHIMPTDDTEPESESLRHGALIGYLERIIIVTLVAQGNFAGLGFLIAAKGLIRSREFEDRGFVEYFLVGTLLSTVCALAIGLGVRAVWVALT